MSDIVHNSGQFLNENQIEDTLTTTPGSVAAAISSALETADAINEETTTDFFNHPFIISAENAIAKSSPEDKIFLSNNNNLLNLDKNSEATPARPAASEYRLFDSSRRRSFEGVGLFRSAVNEPGSEERDPGILSCGRNDADGNYVREIHEVSSACSPFFSSKSTSMAENKESSEFYCVSSSGEKTICDKPDNREAYPVSHRTEKSAIAETISKNSGVRTFRPSCNKIELPETTSANHIRVTTTSANEQHSHYHHRSKDSKIPVGIAVAWQRLVTSTLTNPTASSIMTTKAESGTPVSTHKHNHHHHHNANKSLKSESVASTKTPTRPSSASPLSYKSAKASAGGKQSSSFSSSSSINFNHANENSDKIACSLLLGRESNGNTNANRPLSACGDTVGGIVPYCPSSPITPSASPLSRPLPSSSVPPNIGYPNIGSPLHHQQFPTSPYQRSPSYMEYPYGVPGNSVSGPRHFAIPSPLASPHHTSYMSNGHQYWGGLGIEGSTVPILPPGIPNSPGAGEYFQQSMQQQIHLHHQHLLASSRQNSLSLSSLPSPYSPYQSPFLYPNPQDTTSVSSKSYFDHYFHQQQNELFRQQQQQMQESSLLSQGHHHHPNSGINSNSVDNSNNNSVSGRENNVNTTGSTTGNSSSGGFGFSNHDRIMSDSTGIRTAATTVAPSVDGSDSSAAVPATFTTTTTTITSSTDCRSTITTASQQLLLQSGKASAPGATNTAELSSSYSSASPSPSFLIHQQHLFTSSAALSPKSLTSSTPSPVTVHDFNSGLNVIIGSSTNNSNNLTTSSSSVTVLSSSRKCATPSPISITPRPLLSPFGSPFSPSPTPTSNNNNNNNSGSSKEESFTNATIQHISANGQDGDGSLEAGGDRSQATTPSSSPLFLRRAKQLSVPTPLSSPSSHKHDFKRLESLIERRDSESISPLVLIPQHSPATSTTSSMLDSDESRVLLLQGESEPERKVIPAFHVPKIEEEGKEGERKSSEIERFEERKEGSTSTQEAPFSPPGNDSFKVKPQHTLILQPSHPDHEADAKLLPKAEKVSLKSEESSPVEAERQDIVSDTINCCDVRNANNSTTQVKVAAVNQHGRQLSSDSRAIPAGNETDNIDVPELTLPFSSNTNKKSYVSNGSAISDGFKISNEPTNSSRYSSSSKNDYQEQAAPVLDSTKNDIKNKKRKNATKAKGTPALKIKPGKKSEIPETKNSAKLQKSKKGKPAKEKNESNIEMTNVNKKSKLLADKQTKSRKRKDRIDLSTESSSPLSPKKVGRGKGKKDHTTTDPPVEGPDAAKTKGKRGKKSAIKTEATMEISKKIGKKNKTPKRNGDIGKKEETTRKSIKSSVTTNANTNKIYQFTSDPGTTVIASQPLSNPATSEHHGSSVSGDIISSVSSSSNINYNNARDHNNSLTIDTTSLTPVFSPTQHQQVALILQSPNFTPSATPIPISCPSQVTFLIASPTNSQPSQVNVNPGATIKIPAYIPRSSAAAMLGSETTLLSPTNFSSLTANDIVGDGDTYNGPATLTLHRDVEVHPQQNFYQSPPHQQQPPPAITIQYHHSAPATPLMEALSPYANIKPEENSLDLLATVAQEFGSLEDLGKRHSIDGSCNTSSIGESPPMSPPKTQSFPPVAAKYQQYQMPKLGESIANNKPIEKKSKSPRNAKNGTATLKKLSKEKSLIEEQKKEKPLTKPRKSKNGAEKTINSVVMKQVKAGKKQKRSVSDSAASFLPPPVVLKVPQPPPPCIARKPKKKDKSLSPTNKSVNKSDEMARNAAKILKSENKRQEQQQKEDKKRINKSMKTEEKIHKGDKKTRRMKKPIKALTLPEKDTDKEKHGEEVKVSKKKPKKMKSDLVLSHPISPLKLSSNSGATSAPTSPSKGGKSPGLSTSCFYNPPERISAFAKQVIARRDSAVATSPTKISPGPVASITQSSHFAPIGPVGECIDNENPSGKSNQEKAIPSPVSQSPTIKMPQLIPFDVEPALAQQSDIAVPKEMLRFPSSAPPPLLPSISTELNTADELVSSKFEASVQDKKTDFTSRNRSPINSCRDNSDLASFRLSSSGSTEKPKTKKSESKKLVESGLCKMEKAKKKMKQSLETDCDIEKYTPKKKSEKTQKASVVLSQSPNIPRITITSTTTTEEGGTTTTQYLLPSSTSVSFSPLPTAKPLPESEDEAKDTMCRLRVASSTPTSSRLSSASHQTNDDEGDADTTENENENDLNNVWVSDPMFAVSAVKLMNSCNPSDASSIGGDDDSNVDVEDITDETIDAKKGKRGNKPPKLALFGNQSNNIGPSGSVAVNKDTENQLGATTFVNFTPKRLKGNKKSHNIKPCLKAEPVVRSQSELEEDEDDSNEDEQIDEDFALDMEVANITTHDAPKGKVKKSRHNESDSERSSSTATSASPTKKKPSINRNSFSYLSNSSSKKDDPPATPLSTKEIMTKVFSRKVSPELGEKKRRKQKRQSPSKRRRFSGADVDADDEEDDDDEENDDEDVQDPTPHNKQSNTAQISMSATATAIVVNNASNLGAPSSTVTSVKKTPQKRTARSSTTSSSASTKSSCRGNRGQRLSSMTATPSASNTLAVLKDEVMSPGKVELDSVEELVDEMRILTEIQGLFYTGRLNALQPPDVYGVTLDNERGAPPHLIFSAEEVLEKCLREKKPLKMSSGLRICAYWSPQYSGLYPGRVSSDFSPDFDPEKDLIPIEFDDGDTGMIKLKEIRLLSANHPVREYDPNPLLTLEKKHRKRRHSSATGTSGGCTGDHDEPDCGEPYCAKIEKLKEEEEDEDDDDSEEAHHSSSKMLYWTWSGLAYKRAKGKKTRNKEFFHGIQRGNEAINVGDAALFISTGNERPFIGRVERFWESKGKKMVNVRWFYHPEEVKASAKRLSNLKYPGALFESPHIDQNDVQTIAKKCDVLPFTEFKQRLSVGSSGSPRLAKLSKKSSTKPRDMYYIAGYYDPYTYNLKLKELK